MTSLYMLDTNMVSYMARGRSPAARSRLLALSKDEVACLSAITEAEIRYGLAKHPEASELKVLMEGLLTRLRILPWGRSEAQAYGLLRAKLETSGRPLGGMDMMIAAHAIATQAVLVTKDKALGQVGDLHAVEDWATDI